MKKSFYAFPVALGLFLFFASISHGEVWHAVNQWTTEEELRYAAWVSEYVDENFFINHRIPVDCADVVYALRWIYARIRKLPAAGTGASKGNIGEFIGHWSNRWDALPSSTRWDLDKRFRAALLYVLAITTTESIPLDTYPIQITLDEVTPGTVFLSTEGHTGVVGRIVLDGSTIHPIQTWESSLPAKPQKLNRRDFLMHSPNRGNQSGLLKFRWPEYVNGKWRYIPREAQPAYSEEQYGTSFFSETSVYIDAVAKRIDPQPHDPQEKSERILDYITRMLDERVLIVLGGYGYCSRNACPEGSDVWEDYSTPIRDRKIGLLFWYLDKTIEKYNLDPQPYLDRMKSIQFDIGNKQVIDLYHVYQNKEWLSYDPDDSLEMRWGLRKCEMIAKRLKLLQEAIAFADDTYGKKNPEYAGQQIKQHQEEIDWLRKEQASSQCDDQVAADTQRETAVRPEVPRKKTKKSRKHLRD